MRLRKRCSSFEGLSTESKSRPNLLVGFTLPDESIHSNIIDKLSHSISERLQPGSALSVFDTYIFTKTEHYENEVRRCHLPAGRV